MRDVDRFRIDDRLVGNVAFDRLRVVAAETVRKAPLRERFHRHARHCRFPRQHGGFVVAALIIAILERTIEREAGLGIIRALEPHRATNR